MKTLNKLQRYKDRLLSWKNAPESVRGPEPKPEEFGLRTVGDRFVAKAERERVLGEK